MLELRPFYALDDLTIDGRVHNGQTKALGITMGQEIAYDEIGNAETGTLLNFFPPKV